MTPTLKRGASYSRALIVREGDASAATVRAVIKNRAALSRQGDAAPDLAEFSSAWVSHWDGDPGSPPGWILSLTPEQTAALPADDYVSPLSCRRLTLTPTAIVQRRQAFPNRGLTA